MSFLPINEENKEAPTGQTSNAPVSAPPPQTGGSAGGAQAPKGASAGSPTQFGSSASKLGDYLSANAPQITQQANTLAGNLNQTYGNVSQGITNAANQFGQQVQGGYAANNPDVVNQAMQNPTTFASNPQNVQAFQSLYNDQYTGPQTFEGTTPYSDIQNQVSQAVQQGNLLSTPAGLQSYLQGQGTNPTRASATLDTLLMQGNPEAQATIQNAAGQLGGLTGQLRTATTGADQSVIDAQNAAQAAQAYTQGQFNPYVTNFGNQLTANAADAEAQRQAYNTTLNKFYAQATPMEQQINAYLGTLPGNAGASVPDLIAPLIAGSNQIVNPITAQTLATPDQYAQAQAIQQLLGGTANLPINQQTVGQAGTAPQIPQAQFPTVQEIAQQYAKPLGNAYTSSLRSIAPGWTPQAQNIQQSTQSLIDYLQAFAPQNYIDTMPGADLLAPGRQWGFSY